MTDSLNAADNNNERRVLVVGGGMSGLVAIKQCLAEGLAPVCYEKTADLGGLWNFRSLQPNQATVMRSTIVNTSKEMMAFSDFPCPEHYPNFMHNTFVNEYLHSYADHFDLKRYIKFNTEILELFQDDNDKTTGKWTAVTTDGVRETFDGVMLCTGHHNYPYQPDVAGLDAFKGTVMHSQQYREPGELAGKRVLVLGIGNSALDVAVELSSVAEHVYLSTRRGSWIWNRVSKNGMPFDVKYLTRFYDWVRRILPWSLLNDYLEYLANLRMDHETYGMKPRHRFYEQHPAVNDQLAHCICTGRITLKHNVRRFLEDGVEFVDGTEADIDAVILCTGYTFAFPFFIHNDVIPVKDNEVSLYKFVFPPNIEPPTLAVIGLIQPYGSLGPMSELQSRWVARVFADKIQLPTKTAMLKDIKDRRQLNKQRFFDSQKHTLQVDFVPYMDELAQQIDACPSMWSLLFRDPRLLYHMIIGPNVPYIYRLSGPGKWAGARDAVVTVMDRVLKPIQTRKLQPSWQRAAGMEGLVVMNAFKVFLLAAFTVSTAVCYTAISAGVADVGVLGFFAWSFVSAGVLLILMVICNIHYDLATLF